MSEDDEEEIIITIGKPPKKEEPEEKPVEETEEEGEEEIELEEEEEELEKEEAEELEEVPGEEEVVVISLGKPPAEEEVVEEEALAAEEEEPLEAEVVEEAKPAEEKEAPKRRKWIAILIVIAVVIGSIGAFIFLQNQDPVAKLQLGPETGFAGQLIRMDGSNSTDDKGIVEYTWYFGDETVYSERSGSASDGKFDGLTTHSYEEGDYTVKLTVRDEEDRRDTATSHIAITELEVTIPFEKIGDECTYDVDGSVDVENDDGLWTGSSGGGTFTLKKIHIDYEGYMITKTEGTSAQKDGFGEVHDTLEKYNYEELELSGTISGTLESTTGGSIDSNFAIQDGELIVTDRAYIDLTTDKRIFSHTISDLSISAGSGFEVESLDDIRSYSNLREKPAVFRVEDLSDDRSFAIGDGQTDRVGDIAYTWEVENAANINGYPALGIEIGIDKTTMEKNNIEELVMWLWIANDVSFPIKTYIYTKIFQEGTTITIVYNNQIQEDGFERGTLDIPYDSCTASTPDGHYYLRNPGFEFVEWGSDDYIPDMGSNSTSFDFSPQDAIGYARTNSGDFDNYLAANTGAYVIEGYYNESGSNSKPKWNLTFGDPSEDTGYYVVVEKDGSPYRIIEEDEIDLPELRNSTSAFDPILSFSASEQVFERDEDIKDSAFDASGDVRFYDGVSYGARANMIYPSISLTVSLTVERAEYGYYLNKEDGSFSAAVDGINGQLIYVWEHEGDDIMSLIMG